MSNISLDNQEIVVVGAGISGLAAAIDLARAGASVCVVDRAERAGGKIRQFQIDGYGVDAGPTVLTMRDVFDTIFAEAGESIDEFLTLTPAHILARHSWGTGENLDLHADAAHSAQAIGEFAGLKEARGFTRFTQDAGRMYELLNHRFMRSARPNVVELALDIGLFNLRDQRTLRPFAKLWPTLRRYFKDPRLQQLFARYATYCGSSPYECPATLMLIAEVERRGVWTVDGGIGALAAAMQTLAKKVGVSFRFGSDVNRITTQANQVTGVVIGDGERLGATSVVFSGEYNALASGLLGPEVSHAARPVAATDRSLSAVVFNAVCKVEGFELSHHNVFFSADYRLEFDQILKHKRLPEHPTTYICAQQRSAGYTARVKPGPEPLLCLVNAPALQEQTDHEAVAQTARIALDRELGRHGVVVDFGEDTTIVTCPEDFASLFPSTGGSLYGARLKDWQACFKRPASMTPVAGLYLAGGSTHPGPGVPMAAISGRLAAAQVCSHHAAVRPTRISIKQDLVT